MLITDKTDKTDNTENTNPNWHVLHTLLPPLIVYIYTRLLWIRILGSDLF